MHRVPRQVDFGRNLTPWPGHEWEVTLHMNSRQSVTALTVLATFFSEGEPTVHHEKTFPVAPFDDLREEVIKSMLETTVVLHRLAKGLEDTDEDWIVTVWR